MIRKVEVFNETYRLKEEGAILNWFDIDAPEGYYSLNDKMSDIMLSLEGQLIFEELIDGTKDKKMAGFEISESLLQMLGGFTMLRLISLMGGMMNLKVTKTQLLELNARLNQVPKKE